MGRAKNDNSPVINADEKPAQEIVQHVVDVQNTVSTAQEIASEQLRISALINQRIGRRSMSHMVRSLLTVSDILDLQNIKESKQYKGFVHFDGEKPLTISTWTEYCDLVEGRSHQAIDLDIFNLKQFGEELFDSMRAVGIGPGKMREIRRLPDDARAALIEIAKGGNPDEFIDYAEELIAQHAAEKAKSNEDNQELAADLDATRQILDQEKTSHQQTKLDLNKAKRRIQTLGADEAAKELRQEVSAIAYETEADIGIKLRSAFTVLSQHAEETGTDHRGYQASLVRHLENLLATIRNEFQLPENDGAPLTAGDFGWIGKPETDLVQG